MRPHNLSGLLRAIDLADAVTCGGGYSLNSRSYVLYMLGAMIDHDMMKMRERCDSSVQWTKMLLNKSLRVIHHNKYSICFSIALTI